MIISIEIPDAIAKDLGLDGPNGPRRALEMICLDGYRSELLSRGQVGEVLGLGFHDTEQFLHDHKAYIPMTIEEFNRGAENLEKILSDKK